MKKRKIMWELILVSLAGFITVGLSVNSIIKSKRQENELKAKQDSLNEAQKKIINGQNSIIQLQEKYSNELKQKTDDVIKLQMLLQDKSDKQLGEIERINNPIPENVELYFEAYFELTKIEKIEINDIIKQKNIFGIGDFLLPFDFNKTNKSFEKINSLKDVAFGITIIFEKNGKKLQISLQKTPIALSGYHVLNKPEYFSATAKKNEIIFNCLYILTNDIRTNYKTNSILDFINSDVKVNYQFTYPFDYEIGHPKSKLYGVGRDQRTFLTLNFKSLKLRSKNLMIDITKLSKINNLSFHGRWD